MGNSAYPLVAVFRRDYSVRRLALGNAEFALLAALAAGAPLGAAIERTAAEHPAARDGGRVFDWFRKWVSLGMFARIEVPAKPRPRSVGTRAKAGGRGLP